MVRGRLLQCFHAVFPAESEAALASSSPDTIVDWDSTRHFVLLQSVEEEFDLRIPEGIGGELLSFTDFETYLTSKISPE